MSILAASTVTFIRKADLIGEPCHLVGRANEEADPLLCLIRVWEAGAVHGALLCRVSDCVAGIDADRDEVDLLSWSEL
jgi:hypothetical protein